MVVREQDACLRLRHVLRAPFGKWVAAVRVDP
jgi:hypothetical protein